MNLISPRPGLELLKAINEKTLNPKELHQRDRLILVETLRAEGWGQTRIAQLLQVCHSTIKRDTQTLKDRMTPLVKHYTKERVAADSIGMADGLRQRAIAAGKIEVAWQITKELPALMQSLGLLERAPERAILELRQQFFVEVVKRSKESCEHVDGNGALPPSRN